MLTEFETYDRDNPIVWKMFLRYTKEYVKRKQDQGIRKKRIKLSAWMVMNRIRWEAYISTDDRFSEFKINNNYIAHYARKFKERYPKWQHLFETRQLKTA
jgi:hypothetical protein